MNVKCEVAPQPVDSFFKGAWSGKRQLFGKGEVDGQVTLELHVPRSGRQRLVVALTQAPDYGRLRFLLDGDLLPHTFDGYAPSVIPSGPIELGDFDLEAGLHSFTVKIVGKDSGHHRALALIGRQLQLELLKESPLTYAWLTYALEILLHWLSKLGSKWAFRLAHWRAKKHWADFRERRKKQAIPKMVSIIRDTGCSVDEKLHAVETLGLLVNEKFHHAPDRVKAAEAWLQQLDK